MLPKTVMIEVLEDAGRATARRIFCAEFTNAMFPQAKARRSWVRLQAVAKGDVTGLEQLVEAEREFRLRTDQFTANITVNNRRS